MLHQHAPKIKRPHLLSLGGSCCSKKLKSFSSTLTFKLNTSVWVGWHIYFNLWNSHGWSPLQRGWLYPESTYLPGGPKTAKKAWLAPPFQTGVSAHSQRWQQKQNTGVRKWPVCSAYPPSLFISPRSTCLRGRVRDTRVSYTLLSHRQHQKLTVSIKSWCLGASYIEIIPQILAVIRQRLH